MFQPHEIATLVFNSGGTLLLDAQLSINTFGSMSSGVIGQGSTNGNGPLEIKGGKFTWTGGAINYSARGGLNISMLTIDAGAELDFSMTSGTSQLGDNITIDAAAGGASAGILGLQNTATVQLTNRPTITNNGTINVTVSNVAGLTLPPKDPAVTIQNSGTIKMTETSDYTIQEPVNNKATGALIEVDSGTREFVKGDPSSGYSVTQTAGNIKFGGASSSALDADNGVNQTGGSITLLPPSNGVSVQGTIQARSNRYVLAGGTLNLGGSNPNYYGTLIVQTGFTFNGGTINLAYNKNNGSGAGSLIDEVGNGTTLSNAGTTITDYFFGTGNNPASFTVVTSAGTVTGSVQSDPTGYKGKVPAPPNSNAYIEYQSSSPFISLIAEQAQSNTPTPWSNPSPSLSKTAVLDAIGTEAQDRSSASISELGDWTLLTNVYAHRHPFTDGLVPFLNW
jgi:hypothetical protein